MILMFAASSLIAALVDYVLVLLLEPLFSHIPAIAAPLLAATAVARVASSLCNYFINGKLVFEECSKRSILRYYLLVVAIYAVNYLLLLALNMILPLWLAKIIVEIVLYPVSFYMQRRFVFAKGENNA